MAETNNPFTEVVLSIADKYQGLMESSGSAKVDPFMMKAVTPAQLEAQQLRELRAMYGDAVMDRVVERRKNGG